MNHRNGNNDGTQGQHRSSMGEGTRGGYGYEEQRGRQYDASGWGESHASQGGSSRGQPMDPRGQSAAGWGQGNEGTSEYPGAQGYGGGASLGGHLGGNAMNYGNQGYGEQQRGSRNEQNQGFGGYGDEYMGRGGLGGQPRGWGQPQGYGGASGPDAYGSGQQWQEQYGGQRGYGGGYGSSSGYGASGGYGSGYGASGGYGGGQGIGPGRGYDSGFSSSAGGYGRQGSAGQWQGEQSYGQRGSEWRGDDASHNQGYPSTGMETPRGYRGKGPKGYARSDERLQEDISERLMDNDAIDASGVSVQCKDGIVTLEGTVSERRMKHNIEDLVEGCHGVKDIENRIRVARDDTSSSDGGRSDGDAVSAGSLGGQNGQNGLSGQKKKS